MQNAKSLEEYISILKSEFVSSYDRNAHLYEALPNDASTIPEMHPLPYLFWDARIIFYNHQK